MNKPISEKILDIKINLISQLEIIPLVKGAITNHSCIQLVTTNPEIILAAQKDSQLKNIINHAQLSVPDGVGLIWALKRKTGLVFERISGIDLAEKLFEIGAQLKWKVFLLGGRPGVAETAAENITRLYPGLTIIGRHHGYFLGSETAAIVAQIQAGRPDLLLVGLGAGQQEKFIAQNLSQLAAGAAIGIGGALDIWAGRLKRAPEIFRKLKIEWLYRLIQEPRRFKRILSLSKFVFLNLTRFD